MVVWKISGMCTKYAGLLGCAYCISWYNGLYITKKSLLGLAFSLLYESAIVNGLYMLHWMKNSSESIMKIF